MQKNLHYKPFFDRIIAKTLQEEDRVWIYNDIIPPGKHQYFIVKANEAKIFKKLYFTTVVKSRKEDVKKGTHPSLTCFSHSA